MASEASDRLFLFVWAEETTLGLLSHTCAKLVFDHKCLSVFSHFPSDVSYKVYEHFAFEI